MTTTTRPDGTTRRKAIVRVTFEYPIETAAENLDELADDPSYDPRINHATWHRLEGTWCASGVGDELDAAEGAAAGTSINSAMAGGCWCPFVVDVTVSPMPEGWRPPDRSGRPKVPR